MKNWQIVVGGLTIVGLGGAAVMMMRRGRVAATSATLTQEGGAPVVDPKLAKASNLSRAQWATDRLAETAAIASSAIGARLQDAGRIVVQGSSLSVSARSQLTAAPATPRPGEPPNKAREAELEALRNVARQSSVNAMKRAGFISG